MKEEEPSLGYELMCRLGRMFNDVANLRTSEDQQINEWLKHQISLLYPGKRK